MVDASLIGLFAGICTTFAFVPQVVQTLRTRDTNAISLGMYVIFVLGVLLWLCYGLLIGDLPLIIANAITLALASSILIMKIHNTYRVRLSA